MSGLHKVRLVTFGTQTRIYLDDQEVHGCVGANVQYEINCLPVVKLEIHATDVELDVDCAMVESVEGN